MATDVAGSADGTLNGLASITGGQLVLPNASSSERDYVQLPEGILTNAVNGIGSNYMDPAVTVEAWATFAPNQYTWANLWDFGNTDSGGLGEYDIHTCIHSGNVSTIAGISDSDNANVDYQFIDCGNGSELDGMTNMHIVTVINPPDGYVAIYTNGVLMGIDKAVSISMAGVQNVINKIGTDTWPDSGMQGSVQEFRIYNGALSPQQVAENQAFGPAKMAGPALSVSISGGNLVVSWPLSAAGFTLQSRSSLTSGTWAAVTASPQTVNNTFQVTVPLSGTSQFFRLMQ